MKTQQVETVWSSFRNRIGQIFRRSNNSPARNDDDDFVKRDFTPGTENASPLDIESNASVQHTAGLCSRISAIFVGSDDNDNESEIAEDEDAEGEEEEEGIVPNYFPDDPENLKRPRLLPVRNLSQQELGAPDADMYADRYVKLTEGVTAYFLLGEEACDEIALLRNHELTQTLCTYMCVSACL